MVCHDISQDFTPARRMKRNDMPQAGGYDVNASMVRKGSPVRVRQRAFPANGDISGGQNSPENRAQPTEKPPSACKFAESAAAYASGNQRIGERLFNAAWREFQPTGAAIARGILRDATLTDDALQIASIKVWRSVRSGYQPTHGWRAIAKTAAHHGAVQVLDRSIRYRCDEVGLFDDPDVSDSAQHRALVHNGEADADAEMAIEHLALEAERRGGHQGPLWAAIIRQVGLGHIDRETIAANLGKPAGTIRREIFAMNRTDLFQSLTGREQITYDTEDDGRLFDFQYSNID